MDEENEKPKRERGPEPYHPLEPIKQSRSDEEILSNLARDFHELVCDKELLRKKVEFFFHELIQHLTLGIVLNWHRKYKTESYEVMELDNDDDDDDEDSTEPDVFTPYDLKKNPVTVTCPNCDRGVAAAKFAPHLEACMGMGRSRSRTATRRGMANNHSGGSGSGAIANNNSGGSGGNCSGGGFAGGGPSTSGVNFGAGCSKDFMPRGGGASGDMPSTSSASPGAGTPAGIGGVPSDDEDDMDWNPGNKRSKQKKRTRNGSKKSKGGTPKKSESGTRLADVSGGSAEVAADGAEDEGPSPVNFRDLFQADRHSNSSSPAESVSSTQSSTATVTATNTTPTPTVAAASATSSAVAASAVAAPAATVSAKGKMSKDSKSKSKKSTKKGGGGSVDRSSPSSNISSSAD